MNPLRTAAQRAGPSLRRAAATKQQVRGMATEKQIFMQINATKNIKKITSSMKMVSAAKLKGDEGRLKLAKPFNAWTDKLTSEPVELEFATYEEIPQKTLIVPFTSDRGLCGGINSFISRGVRDICKTLVAEGKEADICVIGDKGRGQMKRLYAEKIVRSATDVVPPGTFSLACALSSEVMAAGAAEYDGILFVYNSFVNAAVYKQKYKLMKPFAGVGEEGEPLMEYEFDGDKEEVMADMYEYAIATNIFHCWMDAAASEQSSRMTAMENASKNANEMIDKLTLQYNRARQARITTELIEIISGASALEG
eukprot:CAMPEP_0194038314 /NCGR_PEP_ID=MMETSP0009_2-20130614/10555_1 /TAXON_ID=210454 /ORGANISM="Grammatophora oceanica, Strain CCMP 410" /LENGTH=309 /DNA_ID=CAMNT_0038680769 /DNA_START=96 /DNA_END=1025 /DNA_ORIENTATION=+